MSIDAARDAFFRANAGIVLVDGAGRVLAMRRRGVREESWQMPQGGIGWDEEPRAAALRELTEETGVAAADVEVLRDAGTWMLYEVPRAYRSAKIGWGQAQRWFLLRTLRDVAVRPDDDEFDAFAWMTPAALCERAAPFRREIYRRVFQLLLPDAVVGVEPA